jgi:hypothetical protein
VDQAYSADPTRHCLSVAHIIAEPQIRSRAAKREDRARRFHVRRRRSLVAVRGNLRQIHAFNPGTGVELLIPDFNAEPALLAEVFGSRPEVLAHNVETVPRIFRSIRPGFRYPRSVDVVTAARAADRGW